MDSQRLDLYIAAWGRALPQPGRAFTAACPGMCKNGPRGDSPPLARGRARWSLEGWLPFAWGKCVLSSGAIKELGYESVARPFFFLFLPDESGVLIWKVSRDLPLLLPRSWSFYKYVKQNGKAAALLGTFQRGDSWVYAQSILVKMLSWKATKGINWLEAPGSHHRKKLLPWAVLLFFLLGKSAGFARTMLLSS